MIDGLEEASYSFPDHFLGDLLEGDHEYFKFKKDLPERDQELLMDSLLIGHPGAMDDHPDNPPLSFRRIPYHRPS